MPEILEKLRADRDLQCYFERPSAIAALSGASATGFHVSGTWRQQFDWAVVEWNRDNVFEHPLFRNLPDGDLHGLVLTYEETRQNCIPLDSDLYPTVDWPYLRVWCRQNGVDDFYQVRLRDHAEPIEGAYVPATAELELQGSPTDQDYVGISIHDENHAYRLNGTDTLESAAQAIVDDVNSTSTKVIASRTGSRITLTHVGEGQSLETSTSGANGNRLGVYGFVSGVGSETWSPQWTPFSGGESPNKWRVTLDFGSLVAIDGRTVPTRYVRKMRWTWAADLQASAFVRSEFDVEISNWEVTGANREYRIAGPGSRRIEDDDKAVQYSGEWTMGKGNFSGGTIHSTITPDDSITIAYHCPLSHELYLGTRYAFNGAEIEMQVDQQQARTENLYIAGEDVLARVSLGELDPGDHVIIVRHAGVAGSYFYFDFLEIAIPAAELPFVPGDARLTAATDWDTDHSIAIAPERTAWLLNSLGFHGRANHYVGALWFYELVCDGHTYASATVDFSGTPEFSAITEVTIGRVGHPESDVVLQHLNRIGDTAETIAKAFEIEVNRGYTAVWAQADGTRLNIYARAMGAEGEQVTLGAGPATGVFTAIASDTTLVGSDPGVWHTDLDAMPRLNRAVRDWCRAYYQALAGYGIDVAAAFSMELQHGDDSEEAGIAQRYPNGDPAWLTTPALQTNFSPTSLAFWRQVYLDMADVMAEAGVQPFLQFGEVQWWYFPLEGSGMPFYDAYTLEEFSSTYERAMAVITTNDADPLQHADEAYFLASLIGNFTSAVIDFVRAEHAACRFEVLYPRDTNNYAFTRVCNYPLEHWTPQILDCLKTESFTFTFERNLDLSRMTINFGKSKEFPPSKRSFLVGVMDSYTAWRKEVSMARAESVESIVLFALDQFCLFGYPAPLPAGLRRSLSQG